MGEQHLHPPSSQQLNRRGLTGLLLCRQKQEQSFGGFQQIRLPSLSFASHMHSVANQEENKTSEHALQAVPTLPMAMSVLPAAKTRWAGAWRAMQQS